MAVHSQHNISFQRKQSKVASQTTKSVFQRKEILIGDIETSYLEAGSGDPVVLLHGGEFGGEAEICWEATIPALAQKYRVIAPDLLGFGKTAKLVDFVDGRMRRVRHLARFIEAIGAVGAPCVGNSMGGMLILFDAASESPLLRPSKIVTIAGGGALTDSPHTEALFAYDGSSEAMKKVVEALFFGSQWFNDAAYIERRRAGSLAPGAWEAVAAARFRRPKEVQEARISSGIDYGRISSETLIIAGEKDKIKPFGWWEELTSAMPRSSVVVVPDAGHCPQIEQPQIVNEALMAFLA